MKSHTCKMNNLRFSSVFFYGKHWEQQILYVNLKKKPLTLSLETKIQSPWENQSFRTTWNYTQVFFWVLVTPIGFWKKVRPCCWNNLPKILIFFNHFGKILTLLLEMYHFHNERSRFELKICFPKCHFLCTKEGLQKLIRETLFLKFGFSGIEYGMHVFKDDFWRQFSNGPHKKKKSFLEKCIWDEGLKYSSALLNVGFIHKGLQTIALCSRNFQNVKLRLDFVAIL